MDIVYIRDLEIQTVIGIYDWEREIRQTVSLDLDMDNGYPRRCCHRGHCQHAGLQSHFQTPDCVY